MKADNVAIGARARAAYLLAFEGEVTQAEMAARLSMTPDALSRALRGERGFASVELVELADLTGADLHELITGSPDPHALSVIARHDYDHATGRRGVPGLEQDEAILRNIGLVYRQAGELAPTSALPSSLADVRVELGEGFVRPLADRVEQRLGIDVVRLPGLSTCYSFRIEDKLVIAVAATGNWFRENFGIAHELGHIVRGHHDARGVPDRHEKAANDFAAELLMPRSEVEAVAWSGLDDAGLAAMVWSYGVSTRALHHRLTALSIARSRLVEDWAGQPTQKLLRRHLALATSSGADEITARMTEATSRRFPLMLREAHLRRIAAGEIGPGPLAWMLGVSADSLDVDAPGEVPAADPDRLGELLGLSRS